MNTLKSNKIYDPRMHSAEHILIRLWLECLIEEGPLVIL